MVGRVFTFVEPADYLEVAELFRFARQRLLQLHPDKKIKAIDVGRLLGFDYKYTHQFSRGRMRIFNVRYIKDLSEKLEVPLDIIVRILRREINSKTALEWCKNRQELPDTEVSTGTSSWDIRIEAALASPTPVNKGLKKTLQALWDKAGDIVEDPILLREFVNSYSGGAPADKAVVEKLKKPKLALSRKGK